MPTNKTTNKNAMTHKTKDMTPGNVQPKHAVSKVKQTITKMTKKAGTKGGAAMIGTAAGAVVGAAVGGIAGRAIADKNTRQKLSELSKNAADIADKVSEKATELSQRTDKVTTKLASDVRDLEKKTNRTK